MKKIICLECNGTGYWEGDKKGNAYYDSVICEDCNGTGYIKGEKMKVLKAVNEDDWHGLIYVCPVCGDECIWKGFKFCPSCGFKLDNYEFSDKIKK